MRVIGSKIQRRKNRGIDAAKGPSSGMTVEFVRRMKCIVDFLRVCVAL